MPGELYYLPLAADSAAKIMAECFKVLDKGKRVIYLAPSRELIFTVRHKLAERYGGMIHAFVGGFEDLEKEITGDLPPGRVVSESVSLILLESLCRELSKADLLGYHAKIARKPGFVRAVYRVIKRLKRLNLAPEDYREKISHIRDRDHLILKRKCEEVGVIYDAYQRKLVGLGLLDIDDRSALAAERVAKGEDADAFTDVELLVIDGFINLDPVNKALLKGIAGRYPAIRLVCHVPFAAPAAEELLGQEIVRDCRELGLVEQETEKCGESGTGAGLPRLAEKLFSLEPVSLESAKGLRIFNAPCIEDEVRQAVREIKRLLLEENEQPENIALVVNRPADYQETILDLCGEMGVPVRLARQEQLAVHPLYRDIRGLLAGLGGEVTDRASAPASPYFTNHAEGRPGQLFPERDKLAGYTAKTRELFASLKVQERIVHLFKTGQIPAELFIRDFKALLAFQGVLAHLEASCRLIRHDEEITFASYLAMLQDAVEGVTLTVQKADPFGVRVVHPDLLRGVRYHHVFVLGLNEGIFPRPPEKSGLFTLQEREALFAVGVNLDHYAWELAREKIRFALTCAAATRGLYLSYRTAAEDGAYMIKSPFLEEIERMLTDTARKEAVGERRFMRTRFACRPEEIWSEKEAEERIVTACWQGDTEAMKSLVPYLHGILSTRGKERFEFVNRAGLMEASRQLAPALDEFDGLLCGTALPQHAAAYRFSASQLKTYNRCPFRYYLENVLGLSAFEDDEELNPRNEGNIYHTVLKDYYTDNPDLENYDPQRLEACFDAALAGLKNTKLNEVIFTLRTASLRQRLERFLASDLAYLREYRCQTGKILRPVYLEKQTAKCGIFGRGWFTAKIDRVDLEFDGTAPTGKFVMYDYKRNQAFRLQECVTGKEDYQLAVYYHCIVETLREECGIQHPECLGLFYYNIEKAEKDGIVREDYKAALGEKRKRNTVPAHQFATLLVFLKTRAEEIIEKILAGRFTLPLECKAYGHANYTCDYAKICRFDRYRLAGKREGR